MFGSHEALLLRRPGNLLITVDHQLKITDFGTAEQLDMYVRERAEKGHTRFVCISGLVLTIQSNEVKVRSLVSTRSSLCERVAAVDSGKDFDMSENCK